MRSWVFWIFLSCMIKNFNWEKSAHPLKTICITVCTHFCWRSRQRYRSLWMSLKKKDLEDELFTWFRYSFVIEITVLWVQRWTEMVPTGFLHNFLEATAALHLHCQRPLDPAVTGKGIPRLPGVRSLGLASMHLELLWSH